MLAAVRSRLVGGRLCAVEKPLVFCVSALKGVFSLYAVSIRDFPICFNARSFDVPEAVRHR
jgi:hypothetical protein